MAKRKLKKFAELSLMPSVYQNMSYKEPALISHEGETIDLRGKWSATHFKNDHPLVLELACGKAEYSRALAQDYPDKNFVAVDLKGNRIWSAATRARQAGIENIAFLRTRIELIQHFIAPQEVSEIWITFPDPFLKKSKASKRLTAMPFLELYRPLLQPGGLLHLKTDSTELYEFTMEVLADAPVEILYHNDDIYAAPLAYPELAYRTYYEQLHLDKGKTIKYIRFRFKDL